MCFTQQPYVPCMPSPASTRRRYDALIAFCQSEFRVCPDPKYWHALMEQVKQSADAVAPSSPFPVSLILGGWAFSSDQCRMERVEMQIRWAAEHGVLGVAEMLLRALPVSDWRTKRRLKPAWDPIPDVMYEEGYEELRAEYESRPTKPEPSVDRVPDPPLLPPVAVPTVLHIPHSSVRIPSSLREEFIVPDSVLSAHVAASTDHFTDELFDIDLPDAQAVIFPINRLAVDPERFEDDEQEPMAMLGLGALYQRGHDGQVIRPRIRGHDREEIIKRWYTPHHDWLLSAVEHGLSRASHALVIDCHSFPDEPFVVDHDKRLPRPDICLGTSGMHTPAWLVDAGRAWCERHGWSVQVDAPYSGSMVHMKHLRLDPRVLSIMIEVNRARYMRLDGIEAVRSERFDECREFLAGLVGALRQSVEAHGLGAALAPPAVVPQRTDMNTRGGDRMHFVSGS
jgi:N-formylglutamate deformylase